MKKTRTRVEEFFGGIHCLRWSLLVRLSTVLQIVFVYFFFHCSLHENPFGHYEFLLSIYLLCTYGRVRAMRFGTRGSVLPEGFPNRTATEQKMRGGRAGAGVLQRDDVHGSKNRHCMETCTCCTVTVVTVHTSDIHLWRSHSPGL